MYTETVKGLFSFIEKCPTAYHAADTMGKLLDEAGYTRLSEGEAWEIVPGGKYYTVRNGSALIAFRIPGTKRPIGFQIMASHDDSPLFKIKENPEMEAEGHYVKLNVEKYGGMILAPWFDRPLSVAGRLVVRTGNGIRTVLVNAGEPLVLIPNLAIHMNREMNDGYKYNVQKDLLPLFGDENAKGSFLKKIAAYADCDVQDIVSYDLFVYNSMKGTVWGAEKEYMSMGQLDDLECVYASLQGFLQAEREGEGQSVPVHCVYDNEEVGSGTRQGAASTFLQDTLERICRALAIERVDYHRMLANSFMLSSDNAHAVHPNYSEKACPTNRPYMNGGIVVKFSANQKYTTDGVAAGIFRELCRRAEVPVQTFVNRSDVLGGSTLGNISVTQVPVNTVDIGLAQLSMHSPYETAGVRDIDSLIRAAAYFFNSSVREEKDGSISIL